MSTWSPWRLSQRPDSLVHTYFLKSRQVCRWFFSPVSGGCGTTQLWLPKSAQPRRLLLFGSAPSHILSPHLPNTHANSASGPARLLGNWSQLKNPGNAAVQRSFGSNTGPSDAPQPGRLAKRTLCGRTVPSFLFPLPLHSCPPYAVITPRLTLQWLLNIKNKNVPKEDPLWVVCPSVLVRNLQTSVYIPNKRAEKSGIFPGIPLPSLLGFSTPKDVGLGLSQTTAAATEATQICCDFPVSRSQSFSRANSPERRISFQSPASTLQEAE